MIKQYIMIAVVSISIANGSVGPAFAEEKNVFVTDFPELGVANIADNGAIELRRFTKRMFVNNKELGLPTGIRIEMQAGVIGTAQAELVPIVETRISRVETSKVVMKRVDGTAVSSTVVAKELSLPTAVIVVENGRSFDPLFSKLFKPETLVLYVPTPGPPVMAAPAAVPAQ